MFSELVNIHSRILLVIASLFAASSIILASIGAHALADYLRAGQLTDTYDKAVDYSYYNALTLLGIAILCQVFKQANFNNCLHWAGYCIAAGGFIFQTSLFLYTLAGFKWLTGITPLGGILMILGWILLGVLSLRYQKNNAV